jgi:ubiquitin C-terminal hydrolase
MNDEKIDLEKCLDEYFLGNYYESSSILNCYYCKSSTIYKTNRTILKQPQILTIIVNRTNSINENKDTRGIQIGKELELFKLNLSDYVYKSIISNEYISNIDNNEFILYGTINHIGGNLGGHYVS